MRSFVVITFKILAGTGGLVLIYASVFLYEDEQGKLQSLLEDLWIKVDDQQRGFISRHTSFMRVVAQSVTQLFNRIFGKRLLSLQSIGVALSYSWASIMLAPMCFYLLLRQASPFNASLTSHVILLIIIYILLGTYPAFVHDRLRLRIWFIIVIMFDLLIWVLAVIGDPTIIFHAQVLVGGVFIGAVSDIVFIAITRRVLLWSSGFESFYKIFTVIFFNSFVVFLLAIVPLSLIAYRLMWGPSQYTPPETSRTGEFLVLGLAVSGSNIPAFITAITFAILAFIMLVHRLFWPLLERPLYTLQRLGVVRRSKLLGTIGIILIGIAFGVVPALLKEIIEKLTQ